MEYIDIHPILIDIFLIKMPKDILDISYEYDTKNIHIQVVTFNKDFICSSYLTRVKENFPSFDVIVRKVVISKETFNQARGEWYPKGYSWLNYVLFSKAEVL